ncbi:hypothetical protein GCM10007874_31900 [Labrys miyagiensis]|uniref:Uncharacterized protein n=1 Tax=Labrys miyagiensis TaxID=346912 RepID=A0ABQ6CIT9_9HYPH|nr:hypothetical protein GCM10007874_31900 [Labrys miyagiensis]
MFAQSMASPTKVIVLERDGLAQPGSLHASRVFVADGAEEIGRPFQNGDCCTDMPWPRALWFDILTLRSHELLSR